MHLNGKQAKHDCSSVNSVRSYLDSTQASTIFYCGIGSGDNHNSITVDSSSYNTGPEEKMIITNSSC